MKQTYDVAIIGAGISGSALFYALTHYTNLKKVVLLEKYSQPATLSSSGNNNSQTIHAGDIETNYTFEKAKKVAPCIVFIDEIDAIGSRRASGSGAETENNQTLNQRSV